MEKLTRENIALTLAEGNEKLASEIVKQLAPVTDELKKAYEKIEQLSKEHNALLTAKADKGKDKYKSLGEQLVDIATSVKKGASSDRMKAIHNIDDAHLGSFLIQPDFANDLAGGMFETGILASRVRTISTKNNMLSINSLKEASRATGSRLGGIRVYWEGELETTTTSSTSFKRQTITLDKIMGAFQASDEVLDDAPFLESYIKGLFVEEFGFQLDLAILKGTGSGAPLGILNSGCILTQDKSGNTNVNPTVDELLAMELKVLNRSRAIWLGNRSVLPALRALKIDTNFYAYTGQGLHALPTDQLLGKEFLEVEQLPVNTTESGSLMLANLDEYTLFKKASGMSTASSIHVDFLKEVNTFRFSMRVSGRPNYDEYITMFDGSTTVSPFVVTA
jgi:HK97 family phage major capsid protein